MAALFDAKNNVNFWGATSASWTHTPVGTPTAVGVGVFNVAVGGDTTCTATYNSVSCTERVNRTTTATFNKTSHLYNLGNPSSGAQTVALAFNEGAYGGAGSTTVTGSDPTTVFSNTTSDVNSGSSIGITACTSAVGELVMDAGGFYNGNPPTGVGAGQTIDWNDHNDGNGGYYFSSHKDGASSVATSWTGANITTDGNIVAGSFKAAASGLARPCVGQLSGVGAGD